MKHITSRIHNAEVIMRGTEDLTNKRFGKWTVIGRDLEYRCNDYNAYWMCRCDCGIEKPVNGSHLRRGKSVSCRKCSCRKHKGKLSSLIYGRIKYGAKKRNMEFDLGPIDEAKKFLYELLYQKQDCRCALSGLPIAIANTSYGNKHGETTASLDRIDSRKGYVKDNVQWVHKWVNKMKWDLDQEMFLTLCESVVLTKRAKC